MAATAAKEFPELVDDFSANKIRNRYQYHTGRREKVAENPPPEPPPPPEPKPQPVFPEHKPPKTKPEKGQAEKGEDSEQVELWDSALSKIRVVVDHLNEKAEFPLPYSLEKELIFLGVDFQDVVFKAQPARRK